MKTRDSAFSYIFGNSLIHRTPALVKMVVLPVLSIILFKTPVEVTFAVIAVQTLCCIWLHFSPRQILSDLRPVIWYALLLYITGLIAGIFTGSLNPVPDFQTVRMLARLFAVLQSTSILFRTSTSVQIRQAIGSIEGFIRQIFHLKKQNKITNTISLFICFIPMVTRNWKQCTRAWYARGGKNGPKMYRSILPSFFSCCLKQAYNAGRALLSRS